MNQAVSISIYKLKTGLHQVSFINPISHKRVRHKFALFTQAKEFEGQIKEQYLANGLNHLSAIKISLLLKIYLEENPTAFMKCMGEPLFLSFIENFGASAAMDVTKQQLEAWLEDLKIKRNYSDRTMPNVKSAVSQFFEYLVDKKIIQENPMDKIKIKRGQAKRQPTKLSEDEIKELLQKIREKSEDTIYPVIYFLVQTGARLGEALKLKWEQISFENGTIHFLQTKNGDNRLIHVSPQLLEFLKHLPIHCENVFTNVRNEPWTVNQYRKQFSKIRKKVGFHKHWTNHCLRHSFAYNYLLQGGNMEHLQALLGHRTLDMTVDLYGKITAEAVKNISPFDF